MSSEQVYPVAVETPQHSGLAGLLAYRFGAHLVPGTLVRVPLGAREVTGIVWHGQADDSVAADRLRSVAHVVPGAAPLSLAWMQLVDFAAAYYQRSVGEVALAQLPPALREPDDALLAKRLKRWAKAAPQPASSSAPPLPALTEEQTSAVAALQGLAAPQTVLLHGVTGSGKTEVYLRAAAHALNQGRQVLVLVPEINLTPQLQARFAQRFPGQRLAVLHSGTTPVQRVQDWLAAHAGAAGLVLGTRLAVFASLPRLGLIVVDEEHDPSFKQQEGARYSARDLAVYRGRLEGVPVLLGSATPALETWAHAQSGRYAMLSLKARIGAGTLPRLRVVDMGVLPKVRGESPALAPALLAAVQARIAKGEQSLLFLNRRGYAPVLHCGACSWKSDCPHCSAWRVFHKLDRSLRCHHCGHAEPVPRACPDCGNLDIAAIGRGTEKLEEQLATLLPGARVARIDADTTRLKGALQAQLTAVHSGEVDVLVGTQMIAKGHDFRRITLVAAVNPDAALFASDFRAPERLFALLMQAAGRAGRDAEQAVGSEMWLQTWHPRHALYAALREHDFAAYAALQLQERKAAAMPPYSHLALLRAEARSADVAAAFLRDATAQATAIAGHEAVSIYPPTPPGVARVANVERMQMLVESASRARLQAFLAAWLATLHAVRSRHKGLLRWAIDVDPLSL